MPRITTRFKSSFTISLILFALLVLTVATPTIAADRDTELNWKRHWRNYARRCVQVGNRFYTCGLYESQYPSSRGVTAQMVREKTSVEIKERSGTNVTIRRHLTRLNEEIDIVTKALPAMAVGQYGWIHSAKVELIGNASGMIVDDVWVIDTEEYKRQKDEEEEKIERVLKGRDASEVLDWRFEFRDAAYKSQRDRAWRRPIKLLGFSTIGLQKDQRWIGKTNPRPTDKPGVEIAIVDEEEPESKSSRPSSRKRDGMLVAVPLDLFKRGITDEKQFLELLKSKGFTKEKFVELVLEERRANARDLRLADVRIFAALDGRLYENDVEGFGDAPRKTR